MFPSPISPEKAAESAVLFSSYSGHIGPSAKSTDHKI
jgi:hypothetical protein